MSTFSYIFFHKFVFFSLRSLMCRDPLCMKISETTKNMLNKYITMKCKNETNDLMEFGVLLDS